MERAEELKSRIRLLIENHEEMDRRHALLDEKLGLESPDPVLEALQKKHLKWEEDHKQVLVEAQALIEQFEERHELHEEMEESHGDVPIKQIQEEHK
ncbi:hypothetical protein ACFLQK_01410 [bacterium]